MTAKDSTAVALQPPAKAPVTMEADRAETLYRVLSRSDPGPGFVCMDGDVGGPGYNETKVDIVAVPCPGADPVQPWLGDDPFPDGYFGGLPPRDELAGQSAVTELAGEAILSPAIDHHLPPATHVWVRQGIRKAISTARVVLYKHRVLSDGASLESLADDLLEHVRMLRDGLHPSRPLFFLAHSVGGLVVKQALVAASTSQGDRPVLYNCHGVGFFGTPHRGSSYMSMPSMSESIRDLLRLERPFPSSLAGVLRLNSPPLVRLHDKFIDIASEVSIWSVYETIDSQLSGSGGGPTSEVQFGAPLVSIKSSLLGTGRERVFPVDCDHASCASLGSQNPMTLESYMDMLSTAVGKAKWLSDKYIHTPLQLKEHVRTELVGFYEDPDVADTEPAIRLYSTKIHLDEFLQKGPELCLDERLSKVSDVLITGPSIQPPATSPRQRSPTRRDAARHGIPGVTETDGDVESLDADAQSDPAALRASTARTQPSSLRDCTAGFSRPRRAMRKFMWMHLPFTNPLWVKDIFDKLSDTFDHDFDRLFDNENWVSRHVQSRHSQSQPSFVKPACNYISAHPRVSPALVPSSSGRSSPRRTSSYLYLYLPYLHFDTYASIVRRRSLIRRRINHGRARPVPEDISDLESLELRVIWQYIGSDPPLNCRRTLDQFGYPSLRDTYSRDDDQMLYKLTKENTPRNRTAAPSRLDWRTGAGRLTAAQDSMQFAVEGAMRSDGNGLPSDSELELDVAENVRDGSALMVDQLWLWAIDTTTLATFFPKRESSPKEGALFQQADLRNSVYNELNGDLTGRTENALDLAAFVALHAVTVLLDRSSHPDLEVFRIFEEAIGMLTERMTSSLKRFRMQTFREMRGDSLDLDDPEGNKPATIKRRYRRELERAERENRENTSALLELRDMEDELTTLSRLFETQETTIKSMQAIFLSDELKSMTHNGQAYLDQALARLDEYRQQATEMLKRVDTTRKDYEKLLEMAQRQAQVEDMRWSRIQTQLASSQNLSVMIFTTFTVIFLPLSFFTSLFGMNTQEWQAHVPTIGFIGAVALPLSFLLIAVTLVAAFSSRVQGWFRSFFGSAAAAFEMLGSAVKPPPYAGAAAAAAAAAAGKPSRRRREERAPREGRAGRERDRSYDFWARVKGQRNAEYRIPDLNMKSPGDAGIAGGQTRPS